MKNENLKMPNGYRAYGIHILDNNLVNRREYNNKIYNELLERSEKN